MLTADIAITGFSANGTDLLVNYDINGGDVAPFDISIYRSSNGTSLDALLTTSRVTALADRQQGTGHSVAIAANFSDVQQDYFLVAVIDSAGEVAESNELNNSLRMTDGIFRTPDGVVHAHGSDTSDTITISLGTSLDVTYNSSQYSYTATTVPSIRVRSHAESDVVTVSSGVSKILWAFGGDGNDTITGGSGNDLLYGGADNDWLHGKGGDDKLYGEGNDDTLYGGLNSTGTSLDYLYGGDGADLLYGDDGDHSSSGGRDYLDGGAGDDILYGEAGTDQLLGVAGNDFLYGGSGNDLLLGGVGDDQLFGGDGDDNLYGGEGKDTLYGEAGNDGLRGDSGDDTLEGGAGNDTLDGGLGNDVFRYSGNGNLGTDTITESWVTGVDTIDVSGLAGGEGVYLDLGVGGSAAQAVNSQLTLKLVSDLSIENVIGTDYDDGIIGNAQSNTISGRGGDDWIEGRGGDDTLYGDAGDDVLLGGGNDDVMYGGSGNDWLYGNDGACGCDPNDNDHLYGEEGDDHLFGEGGDDYLCGGPGFDEVDGGGQEGDEICCHPPTIVDFTAIEDDGIWTFTGLVIDDDDPTGLVIQFGDLLFGYTTIVNEDDTFYFSIETDFGPGGTVTAQTTDWEGCVSNLAIYYVA